MTQQDALELIQRLLKAEDEEDLMHLVSQNLPLVDGTFFQTAEAVAMQLDREGKPAIGFALRRLADRMLRMKTLI